jgi:riboflavin synthase
MFTGIIEASGSVKSIVKKGSNFVFTIESDISHELKVDQSVSHNGVCLTVTAIDGNQHEVVAIEETLSKTSLGALQSGSIVNLERCMVANGRFDGHIVQGHVDQIGECTAVATRDGSWLYDFRYDPAQGNITVEKGSICINGVSLTCFNSTDFKQLQVGSIVNLEFDIIGKYLMKLASINNQK